MKTPKKTMTWLLAAAVGACATLPGALRAVPTNDAPEQIGVYDSRVVAYAWFTSEAHMRALQNRIQTARAAKAAGETNRFRALSAELAHEQMEGHLEVFGSATPTNALTALKERLPLILQKCGATALVSKWDEDTLKQHPNARQIDLTDILAGEFHPNDQQRAMIASIKRAKPLSAREIIAAEP